MFFQAQISLILAFLVAAISFSLSSQDADQIATAESAGEDQAVVANWTSLKEAPKDYAFSPKASRVLKLVKFFEAKGSQDYNDPETRKSQNSLISLPEAFMKLHVLSSGQPLESVCGKYVKLIEEPNIRTYAQVRLLMEENSMFQDVLQPNANLLERLTNERNFDALGRIQTLIQTLEAEKVNLKSSLEMSVQKDLLDCVSYYIYRHQRATFGLVEFAREQHDRMKPLAERSDIPLSKFKSLMEDMKNLERAADWSTNGFEWMKLVGDLYDLVEAYHFEIPKMVQEFVSDPARLDRLHRYSEGFARSHFLKDLTLTMENNEPIISLKSNNEYQKLLCELHELTESNKEILSDEMLAFVREPNRLKLISDNCLEASGVSSKAEKIDLDFKDHISQDESNVKATDVADETFKQSPPVSCREISGSLQVELRRYNENSVAVESALRLSRDMINFLASCCELGSGSSSLWRSRWPILSLTHKLSRWSSRRLQDLSLTDLDKANITEVLESTNKIKAKGIGSLYLYE